MEGIQPPKLSDETRNGFASAVASLPPEGTEAPAGTSEPAPEEQPSPAPETEADPSGVAEETEVTEAEQPATGDEPSAEEAPRGPIPYARFKEINDEKKRVEAELKRVQATGGVDPAVLQQLVESHSRAQLSQIAAQHPELQRVIFGERPGEMTPAQPQNLPGLDPKDPAHAKILAQDSAIKALQAQVTARQRQEIIDDMQERAEDRMETHTIFKNAKARTIGETLIAQRLIQNPRTPVDAVVDDVAKMLRDLTEGTKAEYVKAKVAPTKKIAPSVGGGAAPPGSPVGQKYSMKDGSARKGLEAALRGDSQQA